jgi:hypothetical protein
LLADLQKFAQLTFDALVAPATQSEDLHNMSLASRDPYWELLFEKPLF